MKYRVYVKWYNLSASEWSYAYSERKVDLDEAIKACQFFARYLDCDRLYIVDDNDAVVEDYVARLKRSPQVRR